MEEIKPMSHDVANEFIQVLDGMKNSILNFSETVKPIMVNAIRNVIDTRKNELYKVFLKYSLKYAKSKFWNRWYYKKKYFKAKNDMEQFCIKLKEFENGH